MRQTRIRLSVEKFEEMVKFAGHGGDILRII